MPLMFHRVGQFVEIFDVFKAEGFAKINFAHTTFNQFGNVLQRNSAGPVLYEWNINFMAQFFQKFKIYPILRFIPICNLRDSKDCINYP